MTKKDRRNYEFHKSEARYALELLKKGRDRIPPDRKARLINAVSAHIWLAIGILRYQESYNRNGCRI